MRCESGHACSCPSIRWPPRSCCWPAASAAPLQAGYWFLKESGYKDALACHEIVDGEVRPTGEWMAYRHQLAQWVLAAVRGVRAGDFPVISVDDKCTSTCAYSTVCRVNQVRGARKSLAAAGGGARP